MSSHAFRHSFVFSLLRFLLLLLHKQLISLLPIFFSIFNSLALFRFLPFLTFYFLDLACAFSLSLSLDQKLSESHLLDFYISSSFPTSPILPSILRFFLSPIRNLFRNSFISSSLSFVPLSKTSPFSSWLLPCYLSHISLSRHHFCLLAISRFLISSLSTFLSLFSRNLSIHCFRRCAPSLVTGSLSLSISSSLPSECLNACYFSFFVSRTSAFFLFHRGLQFLRDFLFAPPSSSLISFTLSLASFLTSSHNMQS